MRSTPSNISGLSLKPLGSGDLIDRAVRFYRNHFWTFITIASPPVLIGTLLLVGWTTLAGELFSVNASRPDEAVLYNVFIYFGSILIWFAQLVVVLAVMGGASRNFVRHLLFEEPLTFRETYRNTRHRIFGLLLVSVTVSAIMFFGGLIIFYIWLTLVGLSIILATWISTVLWIAGFVVGLVLIPVATICCLWVFFAVLSRFVYIPQIMLVEGLGALSAFGRSFSLAGRNVTRVGSLFMFTLISIYVVVLMLYLPLWFYAWSQGMGFVGYDAVDTLPAWYVITQQLLGQASLILMLPVLVIGLCLLYVDERVRSEGYDIELMAARVLGEIPDVPQEFVNPLQPAISGVVPVSGSGSSGSGNSTLGLNG